MSLDIFPLGPRRSKFNTTYSIEWPITEAISKSGVRRTLCQRVYPTITFKVNYPQLTLQEVYSLISFYNDHRGSANPFLVTDYKFSRIICPLYWIDSQSHWSFVNTSLGGPYGYPVVYARLYQLTIDGVEQTTNLPVVQSNDYDAWLDLSGVQSSSSVSALIDMYFKVVITNMSIKESGHRQDASLTFETVM